jgi:hypothetical protein
MHTWRQRSRLVQSASCALLLLNLHVRSVHAQSSDATAEQSVRDVELARGEALLKADTVALSRMTAAEFFEISRLGQVRTRTNNMQEVASGALKLLTVKYDSLAVRIYGDVAILTGIADNSGLYRGFPFAGKIRYTRTFVRRDGRWQAVAMQHTPMQP